MRRLPLFRIKKCCGRWWLLEREGAFPTATYPSWDAAIREVCRRLEESA